ncbi:MAG: glutamine-hydrolyzing GMP synthase, partial [Calditrichia bacterium]|nr:glutamine-hydrolyzing GMP synthase [Calditrichia bacterium]
MSVNYSHETIIVLDFGSQYSQLIARKIRELKVFSEIHPFNVSLDILKHEKVKGIILSGGPSSIYEENAPMISKNILDMNVPILGICYGLQLLMHLNNGKVNPAEKKEYGHAQLQINSQSKIFEGIPDNSTVWMSHGDKVDEIPVEFEPIAKTNNSP